MFDSIELKGLAKSDRFGYAAKVPFFKHKRKIAFQPGLNILFGPNGCGKSTILRILGDTMLATQGGVSAVTETSIRDTVEYPLGRRGAAPKDKLGLRVLHDGQPVIFCDPRQAVGLSGSSFDNDFMAEGIQELMGNRERSHGQVSAARMSPALDVLEGKLQLPAKPIEKFTKAQVGGAWPQCIDIALKRMEPSIPKGLPTVLLDEPEANFSLKWQGMLWAILTSERILSKFQVIVASHSPFALGLPNAHYIEMVPGYREEAEGLLVAHFGRARATATPG